MISQTRPLILEGERGQQYFFILDNHAILKRETKTKLLSFDFKIDCRNKLDDQIVGSEATVGSLDFN